MLAQALDQLPFFKAGFPARPDFTEQTGLDLHRDVPCSWVFSEQVSRRVQLGQVAIYCRVSTEDQSCQRQETRPARVRQASGARDRRRLQGGSLRPPRMIVPSTRRSWPSDRLTPARASTVASSDGLCVIALASKRADKIRVARRVIKCAGLPIEFPIAVSQLRIDFTNAPLPMKVVPGLLVAPQSVNIHNCERCILRGRDFYLYRLAAIVNQIVSVEKFKVVPTPPMLVKPTHQKYPVDGIMRIRIWGKRPSHIRVNHRQKRLWIFDVPTGCFDVDHLAPPRCARSLIRAAGTRSSRKDPHVPARRNSSGDGRRRHRAL